MPPHLWEGINQSGTLGVGTHSWKGLWGGKSILAAILLYPGRVCRGQYDGSDLALNFCSSAAQGSDVVCLNTVALEVCKREPEGKHLEPKVVGRREKTWCSLTAPCCLDNKKYSVLMTAQDSQELRDRMGKQQTFSSTKHSPNLLKQLPKILLAKPSQTKLPARSSSGKKN